MAGALVILDAGTGIRELGRALIDHSDGTPIHGDLFLSHAHWDHIQGFPFFKPIYDAGNQTMKFAVTLANASCVPRFGY